MFEELLRLATDIGTINKTMNAVKIKQSDFEDRLTEAEITELDSDQRSMYYMREYYRRNSI